MSGWEVYAVKYADRKARTRADSFIFDDNHDARMRWTISCGCYAAGRR